MFILCVYMYAVSCLDTRSFNSTSRPAFAPALVYIASVLGAGAPQRAPHYCQVMNIINDNGLTSGLHRAPRASRAP